MFYDVEQASRQKPRYPILILDQTADGAFKSGRGILENSPYRIAGGVLSLEREECVEAQRAGGIILLSGILNPELDSWIKLIGNAGLKALAVLICPESEQYRQQERKIHTRLKAFLKKRISTFPVFTHEIERRICCDEHPELRQSAQGFAVSSVLEALEHLGAGVTGGDYSYSNWPQILSRPGFLACTTAIPDPEISIPRQAGRLTERLFWQNSSMNHAVKILVRMEVPEGSDEAIIDQWREELQSRFSHSELECRYSVGLADSPLRVTMLLTGLTVQKVRWSRSRQSILELVHAGLWSEGKVRNSMEEGEVVQLPEKMVEFCGNSDLHKVVINQH